MPSLVLQVRIIRPTTFFLLDIMPPPQGTPNPLKGPGDYTTTQTVHSDIYDAISPALLDLSGRAVLITGASRGVGEQIALAYASAGASFIAIGARGDLTKQKELILQTAKDSNRKTPVVIAVHLDVKDAASVDNAVAKVWEEFGRLDILINNAGVLGDRASISESDPDSWWSTFETNLKGPYLVARKSIPCLLDSKDGLKTLVTVTSVGAFLVSPGLSAYQTSKLAVLRVTDFIAREYADQGIIAINVHPGNMLTDIVGKGESMDESFKASKFLPPPPKHPCFR